MVAGLSNHSSLLGVRQVVPSLFYELLCGCVEFGLEAFCKITPMLVCTFRQEKATDSGDLERPRVGVDIVIPLGEDTQANVGRGQSFDIVLAVERMDAVSI